jgi:hypothetical protein
MADSSKGSFGELFKELQEQFAGADSAGKIGSCQRFLRLLRKKKKH